MQMQIIIEKFLRSEKSHEFKLTPNEKILLVMLASYMGNKIICWPTYETLLLDTGIGSKSTLNQSLKKLETLSILKVERQHRKNNKYSFEEEFLLPWVQICTQQYQKCTQQSTNLYSNNINNNKKNNNASRDYLLSRTREARSAVPWFKPDPLRRSK